MQETKNTQDEIKENSDNPQPDEITDEGTEQSEKILNIYKRKRDGKFVSQLDDETLNKLQKRKSLYMYLSTLMFAVSLFLQVEGRTRLSDNKQLFPLFTLYVLGLLSLIVLTVYISVMNRTWQKIGRELKEANTPRGGLNKHTFFSYEIFNALHVIIAGAEVAVSIYKIGVWGVLNIIVSAASAVLCFISRQILYKANANNLKYISAEEIQEAEQQKQSVSGKKRRKR